MIIHIYILILTIDFVNPLACFLLYRFISQNYFYIAKFCIFYILYFSTVKI